MGAWGAGNFENDDALDWVFGLDDATDTQLLESTFAEVLSMEEQPESPDACNVLAAGEVVAALSGKPSSDELPEGVQEYLKRVSGPPSDALKQSARAAIEKIRSNSELRDLWDEEGTLDEWLEGVDELLARLPYPSS